MPIPIWEWSDSEFPSGVGFLYRRPQVIIQVKTVIGKLVERRGTTYLWKTFLMVQNMFHAVVHLLSKTFFFWAVSMSQNNYVRFLRITVCATICICLILLDIQYHLIHLSDADFIDMCKSLQWSTYLDISTYINIYVWNIHIDYRII